MKQILVLCLSLIVYTSNVFSAVTVNWRGFGSTDWLYDSAGGYVGDGSYGTQWLLRLVVDNDSDNNYSTMLNNYANGTWGLDDIESGDVIVDTAYFDSNSGGFDKVKDIGDTYASKNLYILFFNAYDTGSATEIGVLYATSSFWQAPAVDGSSEMNLYDYSNDDNVYGTVSGGSYAQSSSMPNDDGSRWYTVLPVPEPQTWGLMAMGLGMILVAARRKLRK